MSRGMWLVAYALALVHVLLLATTMPRQFSLVEHEFSDKYEQLIESANQHPGVTLAPQISAPTRTKPVQYVRFPIVSTRNLSEIDRQWLVSLVTDLGWTMRGLCILYEGLGTFALRSWRTAVSHNLPTKNPVGNPHRLTENQIDQLQIELDGYNYRAGASYHDAHQLINKLAQENFERTHPQATPSEVHAKASVDIRTENRILDYIGFDEREAKRVTEARQRACESLRHSFSWAVAMEAFAGKSPAYLKSNADGTTVTIRFDKLNGSSVMVPKVLHEHTKGHNLRPEVYGPSEMDLIVKHMHLTSASGETDGLCLIFQDKDIPDGVFYWYDLQTMNCTTSKVNSRIYFCKSRAGNANMWQHWLTTRVAPFCERLRRCLSDDDAQLPAIISTDGEPIILNQAFSAAVMEIFDRYGIIWVRVPASTTSIHQACDRGMFFRKFNHGFISPIMMRNYNDLKCCNDLLGPELKRVINYPGVTAGFVDKVVRGCLYIEYVVGETLKKTDVMMSFVVCGQHGPASSTGSTIDFRKIMKQCHTEIDETTMLNLELHLPFFVEQMKQSGALSWDDMDEKNISKEDASFNREQLVIARRAAEVISHPNTRQKKREWDLAHDEEVVKARRLIEKDRNDRAKAQATLEAKQRQAEEKAVAEQARRNMTPAQRAQSAQNRKIDADNKKRQREDDERIKASNKAQAVEDARALLARRDASVIAQPAASQLD